MSSKAVYILQFAYIEELLATVKKFFCDKFASLIRDSSHKLILMKDFNIILDYIEE
ncbi:hypothetical protein GLOIN_2v1726194 [Rhizophagus irregularis DAOM 181602=DAOM 197198]|uniref:Uncharacterized protein n=1 Tax=Rhizophagus irregularis (strain DAOM 181602 / DAOM 197198 / MUCL 43194) TaxID=747089 RepID=A0A2P4P0U4_RHIID|nr:hypothetical protein GLOIN_2v1726194 [Rhizophagus irregularis DAOM 181602=DAOM 197198]POG58978.1 hypothetical protein GLOIN_2v1726194 [Rhizophagus irregularis DAOM 181602=DAOM 197198]|eukprot:XP_025165844.1 hypothetical protein GLOIN_2v1726194 [Rhizophagus irregularis DAOM 181602=DAOM 197198]